MSITQNSVEAVDRRWFCRAIVGVFASLTGLKASVALASAGLESEFVVINGWVLTRQDITDAGRSSDAV